MEARDALTVDAEILADCQAAVAASMTQAAAQQAQAVAWVDGGMPEGNVTTPGAADAPNQ